MLNCLKKIDKNKSFQVWKISNVQYEKRWDVATCGNPYSTKNNLVSSNLLGRKPRPNSCLRV